MINRTYVVKMPTGAPTGNLDILVQSSPGSLTAPVTASVDGAYYEVRGRSLRFESTTGSVNANNVANFVPRGRLGIAVSITPLGNAAASADIPVVQLSTSLFTFNATATTGFTTLTQPAESATGPFIRLIGAASNATKFFLVTLLIAEDRDEDRSPGGR